MRPKAYDVGFALGQSGNSNDGPRRYETDKAQKEFTQGYIDGLKAKYPTLWIVRCNRESRIFATAPRTKINCPTCGRTYIQEEDGVWRSDRDLTIIFKSETKFLPEAN